MQLEWKDKKSITAASHALARLEKVLGFNEEGAVTLGLGGDFDLSVGMLAWSANFRDIVPQYKRIEIMGEAVVEAKKAGDFSAPSILRRASAGQQSYINIKPQQYVLLSTLSLRPTKHLNMRRFTDCTFRFSESFPAKFVYPDTARRAIEDGIYKSSDYTYVRTEVTSREPRAAGDLAIDTLDYLRAIWNLSRSYGWWRTTFAGTDKRFNNFVFGYIHTLHYSDGTPAWEPYWIEPTSKEPRRVADVGDYAQLVRFERWVRRRIGASSMQSRLTAYLVRYVRALDEPDLSSSFLKLWAVLEDLTATGRSTYDVTIRRASFVLLDRPYHRNVLEYLRTWRNRIVHEGASVDDAEQFINQLNTYVHTLLLFLLRRSDAFSSMEEFGMFLDLPTDAVVLRQRLRHHELAIRTFALDSKKDG